MNAFSALVGLLLGRLVLANQPFVPGKQYEFRYEGRVASGIIGVPPQYAGLGIKAKILCTPKDPENIVVEIKEPRTGILNEKLRSEQQLYSEELPISYSPISQFARELETPFVVSVRSGVVTSIQLEKREPTVIKNIKKSVVSMIKMNLNGVERIPQQREMLLPETEDKSQQMSFTVTEESVIGICETLYTISPLSEYLALAEQTEVPQHFRKVSSEGHLVVTKTINLANCIKKSAFQHVAPQSEECVFPEASCKSTQSRTSYTRYLIEGKRNNYLLKAIWNKGTIIMRPTEADIKVMSHQTLYLQSVTPKQAPQVHPLPTESLLFDILTMTPGVQTLDEQTLMKKPIFPLEPSVVREIPSSQIMRKILQLLEEVSREVEEYRRPEQASIPMKTLTIVKGIQMLKYQDLKAVTRHISRRNSQIQQEQTKIQVYLDCLALAGTNPSILVIQDLISEQLLKEERAAQVLMTIPMTLKIPAPRVIEKLVEIAQMPQVRYQPQVISSALLALSHVTYKACINQKISRSSYPVHFFREEICKPDSEVVVSKVIPFLQQVLQSAKSQDEKEVAIRALANVAHPQALEILKPHILGSQEYKDVQTRTIAILSLKRLAMLSPKQVRKVLIPIMSNPLDDYQPRIAAFTMLLETNPPPVLFHQIALMTWMEPSQQVQSYIYSTFKTLSKVTYPTLNATELATKSKMALLVTKPVEEGVYYSKNLHLDNHVKELDVASLLRLSYVSSVDSLIPRTLYVKLYSYLFGYKYQPLEVSLFNQGTQTLINKLLFPKEARQQSGSLPYDFWSQSGPEILNKIKADIRNSYLAKGKLYVKLYDTMERTFSYDEANSIIKELMEQQTLNLEKLNGAKEVNYQKVLPQRDYLVTVPTELGFPVVISSKMPTVFSLRGRIQSQIQPSRITPSSLLKNQPPLKLQVTAEIKPLISIQRLTTSSIITPFFPEELVSGVEQLSEFALSGKLQLMIDTSSYKVELDYQPAQQPSEVFIAFHQIRPFTALYNPVELKPLTLVAEFKVIQKPAELWKESVEFGKKYLGLDFIAELETEQPVVGFAKLYETLKHHTPLTALNFLYALPRPVCNQKMALIFRPSNSETKSVKTTYQYKSLMIPYLRNVTEEDYESYKRRRHLPVDYFMRQDTKQQQYEPLYNAGLPLPRAFKNVPYKSAVNHTIYANIKLEGITPRIYLAMASIVNYATPQVYTVNMTMAFRVEQVPQITPAAYYVETVLQLPTIKERQLQELLSKPVYAVASTNVTLPEHKMIQFRVKMQRDEHQKQFAVMSPESKGCQENEQQGLLYSHNCTLAKLQAASLNNITVEIMRVGTPISETTYKMLYSLDNLMKCMYYPHLEIDPILSSTKPSDVELYLRRDPFRQVWDIEAKKPYEVTRFHNVPEKKTTLPYILPLNLYLTPEPISPKSTISEQLYPTCNVQSTFLKTFDNITLPLGEVSSNRWHLLAKDCSNEARVAVLVKFSSSGKNVKIVLGKTEVIIQPSGQLPQVSINGKQVPLRPESLNHPVYEYEQGYPVVLVKSLPSKKVEIYSPLYQIKVYHDGQNVIVEPFSAYRGRMCGLCGDLNGECVADLKTLELCALNITKSKEFVAGWIVPEESSHSYKVPEKECYRPQYLPTGLVASEIAPAILRNARSTEFSFEWKHIEFDRYGQKCYSVYPIKVCKDGYEPSSYQGMEVDFFCAPQDQYVSVERREVNYNKYMERLPLECVRQ